MSPVSAGRTPAARALQCRQHAGLATGEAGAGDDLGGVGSCRGQPRRDAVVGRRALDGRHAHHGEGRQRTRRLDAAQFQQLLILEAHQIQLLEDARQLLTHEAAQALCRAQFQHQHQRQRQDRRRQRGLGPVITHHVASWTEN